MRKKDYELIAEVIAHYRAGTINSLEEALAEVFAADNPKFDKQKFLAACGIETGLAIKSYGDLPAYDKPPVRLNIN
jgi:hypothetical protein